MKRQPPGTGRCGSRYDEGSKRTNEVSVRPRSTSGERTGPGFQRLPFELRINHGAVMTNRSRDRTGPDKRRAYRRIKQLRICKLAKMLRSRRFLL